MKNARAIAILGLLGLAALAACRHPADYDGVRQRSDAAHQSLDRESAAHPDAH